VALYEDALLHRSATPSEPPGGRPRDLMQRVEMSRSLDRELATRYAPPCLVVNEQLEVLQTRGDIAPMLQREGAPAQVSRALEPTLRGLIAEAKQASPEACARGLTIVGSDGSCAPCDVRACKLVASPDSGDALFAVMFEPSAKSNDEFELRRENTRLTQLNRDLNNVFAVADVPLLVLDAAARVRCFTEKALQIVDVREADVGRPLSELGLNIDVPDLGAEVQGVITSGLARESEVRDLTGRWHRLNIRPYGGRQSQVEGVVISLVDIDALRDLLRRAQRANEDAEQANRAKDEFLATLSHELRAPLHSVLVYAQLLQRGTLKADSLQRAGEAIESGVLLLVQLIDELLDVSRIMNGKFMLNLEPVDLVAIVRRALESVAEKCARKLLSVSASLPSVLHVSGDALRLQQVVGNLLSNAVKFTPARGLITISLRQVEERALLSVRDDGVGIDPGFLPHVFERFSQANSSLTREFGGLGLGLNIVRHIVELHGGEVSAASEGAGQGAVFTVTLPRTVEAQRPALPVASPRPTHRRALEGVRILVVDDDHAARQAITEMLSQAGAEVLSAPSAADALEAVLECEPQLMVCDIAMPDEDGYSLIRRVRALADPQLAHIPALAVTALARSSDRDRALEAGYQAHLAKPVDIDVLMHALSALRAESASP
ncbi:MAG TPA: ATP-binding protein, partial [Polyangiales bacterium]